MSSQILKRGLIEKKSTIFQKFIETTNKKNEEKKNSNNCSRSKNPSEFVVSSPPSMGRCAGYPI